MPTARANGLDLYYEPQGRGDPLVLIMGIGAQLVIWPDGFCDALAARGFRVIRFDHRDVGLSSKLDAAGTPHLRSLMARAALGLEVRAPYTMYDMADDVAGLLDAIDISAAHLVGVSMGGMIAQCMAIHHPHRVLSLVSMMSHTGELRHLLARPRVLRTLFDKPPRNRGEAMDRAVDFYRAVGGSRFELDAAGARGRAGRAYDRCSYPAGFARHTAALLATGARTAALRLIRVPTLVIHGTDDPLIRLAGGITTANAVAGAHLELIAGMGHELPEGAWPAILDGIEAHARRAVS